MPHKSPKLCAELAIEHLATKPQSPLVDVMPDRFNGWIAGVLKINRFVAGDYLKQTIIRYGALHNIPFPPFVFDG